jgi:hypothetical protein
MREGETGVRGSREVNEEALGQKTEIIGTSIVIHSYFRYIILHLLTLWFTSYINY